MRILSLLALSCALLATGARAGDPASRTAMEPRNLASVATTDRRPVVFEQKGYDEMAAALTRANAGERAARARGAAIAGQARPAQPVDTLPGKCVPFKVPAPHQSMQDYCRALQRLPWKEADALFRRSAAPSQWLGVRGCTFGCVIGDNTWANLASGARFWGGSWTGKCITEKANGQAYEVFQALCPFCGGPNAPRSWTDAAPSDLAVPGVRVKKGETSWIDGKPVWVFNYDGAKPAFGFDFRGFRDELRQAAPGLMVGKMITTPTNGTYNNGWNPSDRSVEQTTFILMQACASNGEYASRPIDRVAL